MSVVLYVDDDVDDLLIFRAAARIAAVAFDVRTAEGSEEGLRYLAGRGPYGDRLRYPLPAVLLLDVKMAGPDGFDVLDRVRAMPELAGIPVILFTSAALPAEANRARAHGAVACLCKPVELAQTAALLRALAAGLATPDTLPARLQPFSVG